MVSHPDTRLEKINKLDQLREELYSLMNVYGIDHQKVLEFSRKLDALIVELLQMEAKQIKKNIR